MPEEHVTGMGQRSAAEASPGPLSEVLCWMSGWAGRELLCPARATGCPHEASCIGLGAFGGGTCCKTLGKEMGLVFYLSLGGGQYKIDSYSTSPAEKPSHKINWHEYEMYTSPNQLQRRLYPKALFAVIHRA